MDGENSSLVALVDDDASVRRAMARLLAVEGIESVEFDGGREFIDSLKTSIPAVVILDLQMPGMNGLQVHDQIRKRYPDLPVIFLSAYGTVPVGVTAVKKGARDFLEKPVDPATLIFAIREALHDREEARGRAAELQDIRVRLSRLSPRELEVFWLMAQGGSAQAIADELGVVLQTSKVHRSRVLQKMEVGSLAELGRIAERLRNAEDDAA
jgi:FixJ family two-component response regulator